MDFNHDNARHTEPVGFRAAALPATYLTLHGTDAELAVVHTAIELAGEWLVLNHLGPLPCQPEHGCHHLHLVVLGQLGTDDLADLLARLGINTVQAIARLN